MARRRFERQVAPVRPPPGRSYSMPVNAKASPELLGEARAFWVASPGRGEIRTQPLPPLRPGEVLVRAVASAVSRGTESLVFRGEVPRSEWQRMRCPVQEGEFPGTGQIRLFDGRGRRGRRSGAARPAGLLPPPASGPVYRAAGGGGRRARRRPGPARRTCRQHGNRGQRAVGWRARPGRPDRGDRRGGRRLLWSRHWRRGCPAPRSS